MKFEKTVAMLRSMAELKIKLEALEECLDCLSYEERLVVEMMCMQPGRGKVREISDCLNIEKSSVYRIKDRALQKIEAMLVEKRWETSGTIFKELYGSIFSERS